MFYTFEDEGITCCYNCPLYDDNYGCCNLETDNLHLREMTFKGEGRPGFCKLEEHDETR